MSSRGVLQKDGSYCRKGASCKRHGAGVGSTDNWQAIKQSVPRPADLSSYYEEEITDVSKHLKACGFKGEVVAPYWNDEAVTYGLAEIECDKNTSLLVAAPSIFYPHLARNVFHIWLVKNGETVGVIKIMAQRTNEPVTEITPETVVSCIEVKAEHRGKKYSQEMISLVEKHAIGTRIHSGGHYTPEGAQAMKGKLPYTRQALQEKEYGGMGIGIHFSTMTFVRDWDTFEMK